MKKIILAAAIASVLAPLSAVADTKVYGALRMSAVSGESNGGDFAGVVNNASRLGVKGSYGDEGGLTGFFNIQTGVRTDGGGATDSSSALSTRFAMAGVKGGFGTAVVGRLSTPYKMAGLKLDPFYDTSAGAGNGGSNYGLSSLTNGWVNNVVGYISPKLGGSVTLNAVAVLDKDDNNPNISVNDNLFNVGATYSAGGITAAVQHITGYDAAGQDNPTRLSVGYKAGGMSAGISYEDNAGAIDGADALYIAGTYKVAPKTTLAASYGSMGDTGTGATGFNTEGDGFALGVFHKIAPKTTITAMYSDVDSDNNGTVADHDNDITTAPTAGGVDRDVFAIGLIQKF